MLLLRLYEKSCFNTKNTCIGLLAFSESESDSFEETVIGNVIKFCVVPPGYTGQPKKGHLIFNADFECGNVSLFCSLHRLCHQCSYGTWDLQLIN